MVAVASVVALLTGAYSSWVDGLVVVAFPLLVDVVATFAAPACMY